MKNIFENQIDIGMSVCESLLKDHIDPNCLSNELINDHYMLEVLNHKYSRKITPDYVYDFVFHMYPRIHVLHHKNVVQEVQHVNVTVETLESLIDLGLNKIIGRIGIINPKNEPAPKVHPEVVANKNKHRVLLVGFNADQESAIIADKDPRVKFRCISYVALSELKQAGEFDVVLVSRFIDHATWNMARKKAVFSHFCSSPNEARSKIKDYLASL